MAALVVRVTLPGTVGSKVWGPGQVVVVPHFADGHEGGLGF